MNLAHAKKKLVERDPFLKDVFARIRLGSHVPSGQEPYEALISAIAHQMVHGKAAEACLARLKTALLTDIGYKTSAKKKKDIYPADGIVHGGVAMLRACGFSTNKSLAIFELAQKKLAGTLPTKQQLAPMSDEEVIRTLVPLRGVGRWTVEMYLMFSLGRRDIFPVDDFGVREGYRLWQEMKTGKSQVQEKPAVLKKRAERWAPYRTVVALAMWKLADMQNKYKK